MLRIYNSLKINANLYMNHLLVVYSFILPISSRALSTIFSLILILFIIRGNYSYYLKKSILNKIVQACLLFMIVHIIWLYGTNNFNIAKIVISEMKYLLYPIIFLSFVDIKFSFRIIAAFIFGMLYSELISYGIHFGILPPVLNIFNFEIYKTVINDPTPFLDHSRYNVFISISLGLMIYNLLVNKNNISIKFISIILIITASINLTLVGGRIGYITYFIIIFLVFSYIYREKIIKFFLFFIVSSVFIGYTAYTNVDMVKDRINETIVSVEMLQGNLPNYKTSTGYRVGFWIYSFEVIKNNFLFGVGTGDHMKEVENSTPEEYKYITDYLSHPHNEYIKTFLQFGFIGFVIFLNIFYQFLFYNKENDFLKFTSIIVITGIMIGIFTSVIKLYLILLVLFISVCTTRNNFISSELTAIGFRSILNYIILILIFLIFAGVQ